MTNKSVAAQVLVGETFRVVEIGGVPALPAPSAELEFGVGGRLGGRATINRVAGTYVLDDDTVSFGPLVTTLMAGTPEAMAQERAVLAALGQALTVVPGGIDGRVALVADGADALLLEYAELTE